MSLLTMTKDFHKQEQPLQPSNCATFSPFLLWMIFPYLAITTVKFKLSVIIQNILFSPETTYYFFDVIYIDLKEFVIRI